jgi:hypothetical protein
MTVTRDLLYGIAGMLNGVAVDLTWLGPGTGTGILMKTMPDSPDRCIVLNVIPQNDNITIAYGEVDVQLAARGARNNPLDVDDILDAAFVILHGAKAIVCGSVTITQMNRFSSIPMGQDQLVRNERVDKYRLTLDYPTTTLRPPGGSW